MDQPAASAAPLKWYKGLERYCWVVLIIAALGWLFDTMDQNLFNLVRRPSLMDLLRPRVRSDFQAGDFKDPVALAVKLRDGSDPLSAYLHGQLPPATQRLLN